MEVVVYGLSVRSILAFIVHFVKISYFYTMNEKSVVRMKARILF